MPIEKTKSTIIVSILSLIVLAFITYATVYEQILSQNNGFFNVIIFGVVLILIFIFITLIARVIGLRPESEASVLVKYLGYAGLIAMFALFIVMRLKYTSSVPIMESIPLKTAGYLCNGNLYEGNEISNELIYYPSNFMYAIRLLPVYLIFGGKADATITTAYIVMNIILMVVLAFLVFLTVYLLSNKVCAYIAAIIILFMPGNSFLVYSYNAELSVAVNFVLTLYLYLLLILKRFKSDKPVIVISIVLGLYSGATICAEPALTIVYVVLFIWLIMQKKQIMLSPILTLSLASFSLILFMILKTVLMKAPFGEVIMGFFQAFNPVYNRTNKEVSSFGDSFKAFLSRINDPSRFLSKNFYYLKDSKGGTFSDNQAVWLKLADQLIYIFMLLLCVILIVYILRSFYNKVVPGLSVLISAFVIQFLGGVNDVNYFYYTSVVVILGSTTIFYMYLNHHLDYAREIAENEIKNDIIIEAIRNGTYKPEIEKDEDEPDTEEPSADMLRARAIVFIGENEALYAQIKEQERIERINNPVAATKIQSRISESGEYESKEETIEFLDNLDEKVEIKTVSEVKAIPATRPVEVVKPILAESYDYDDTPGGYDKIGAAETSLEMPQGGGMSKDAGMAQNVGMQKNADLQQGIGIQQNAGMPQNNDVLQDLGMQQNAGMSNNTGMPLYVGMPQSGGMQQGSGTTQDVGIRQGYNVTNPVAYNDAVQSNLNAADTKISENVNNDLNNSELHTNIDKAGQAAPNVNANFDPASGFVFRNKKTESSVTSGAPTGAAQGSKPVGKKNAQMGTPQVIKPFKEKKKKEKPVKGKKIKPVKPGEPLDNPLPLPKPHVSKDLDFDYNAGDNDDFDWN